MAQAETLGGDGREITLDGLADRLLACDRDRRRLIALAGPPGAGKSYLAQALVDRLEAAAPGRAALLAMDGFHYDDAVLEALGRRARKGAPDTFDAAGLAAALERLRAVRPAPIPALRVVPASARDPNAAIAVPVFDRAQELARAGAALIWPEADLIVVEGNYLLQTAAPWDAVAAQFDLRIFIDVPEPVLRARLERRWRDLGLAPAAVAAKVEGNDLPNGRTLRAAAGRADFVLKN